MSRPLPLLTLAALLAATPVSAATTISGPVRVIDGDTIVVGNTNIHVRLNGVHAPEIAHPGYDHDDPLGPEARDEMKQIIGDQIVRCELNGERSHERLIGVCYLPDGVDVGAEIIRRGLALDCARFSGSRYRSLEAPGARLILRQAAYCQRRTAP